MNFVQVQEVLNHFNIVKYIGVGVGLGANILVRHALGESQCCYGYFELKGFVIFR